MCRSAQLPSASNEPISLLINYDFFPIWIDFLILLEG